MLKDSHDAHDADPASLKRPASPSEGCLDRLRDCLDVEGPERTLQGLTDLLRGEAEYLGETVAQDERLTKEERGEKKARMGRLERVARLVERGAELAMRL